MPHIGQFFWDQSLIDTVEATSPYNTNTQPLTKNSADRVFGQQETQGSTSDPVFNYVYFSDDLSDGLFTWLVVGINTSAEYSESHRRTRGLVTLQALHDANYSSHPSTHVLLRAHGRRRRGRQRRRRVPWWKWTFLRPPARLKDIVWLGSFLPRRLCPPVDHFHSPDYSIQYLRLCSLCLLKLPSEMLPP